MVPRSGRADRSELSLGAAGINVLGHTNPKGTGVNHVAHSGGCYLYDTQSSIAPPSSWQQQLLELCNPRLLRRNHRPQTRHLSLGAERLGGAVLGRSWDLQHLLRRRHQQREGGHAGQHFS